MLRRATLSILLFLAFQSAAHAITVDLDGINQTAGSGRRIYKAGLAGGTTVYFASATYNFNAQLKQVDTNTGGSWVEPDGSFRYGKAGFQIFDAVADTGTLPSYVSLNIGADGKFNTLIGNISANHLKYRLQNPYTPTNFQYGAIYAGSFNFFIVTITSPCFFSVYLAGLDNTNAPIPNILDFDLYYATGGYVNLYPVDTNVKLMNLVNTGAWIQYYLKPGVYNFQQNNSAQEAGISGNNVYVRGVFVDTAPAVTGATTPVDVFEMTDFNKSWVIPDGTINPGAGWAIDRGASAGNWATPTAVRIKNIADPEYDGANQISKAQNLQLSRQIDQVKIKGSTDATNFSVLTASYTGTTPVYYQGFQWTEIPVSTNVAQRVIGAFVDTNYTVGTSTPLSTGIAAIRIIGTVSAMGPYDLPVQPALSPASFSLSTGVAANTPITMTTQTSGCTIYYTTDGSLPVADVNGSTVGVTQKYASGVTLSATTLIRAIAGCSNANALPSSHYVYSRDVTQGMFVVSNKRIYPNSNFWNDGTEAMYGTTVPPSLMSLQDMSVLNNTSRDGYFYAYGQYKMTDHLYLTSGPDPEYVGVFCYRSTDLSTWKSFGRVLGDWTGNNIYEQRPIVVYRKISGVDTYVLYYHSGSTGMGYATSINGPTGPFTDHGSLINTANGDPTILVDDNDPVNPDLYAVWASGGITEPKIQKLTANGQAIDLTWNSGNPITTTGWTNDDREGMAAFKRSGVYYLISSHAEYYTSSITSDWQYISATTPLNFGSVAVSTALWSSQGDYSGTDYMLYMDSAAVYQGFGTLKPHPSSPSALQVITATNTLNTFRDWAYLNVAFNVQSSNVFILGTSSQPVIVGDYYVRSALNNGAASFSQNGITMIPLTTTNNALSINKSSTTWDIQDYIPSALLMSVTGASTGAIGIGQTISYTPDNLYAGTITLSDGAGCTSACFSPTSLSWSGTKISQTSTYTPISNGVKTIGGTTVPTLTMNNLTMTVGVATKGYAFTQ